MNITKNKLTPSFTRRGLSLILTLIISGCATTSGDKTSPMNEATLANPNYALNRSYLAEKDTVGKVKAGQSQKVQVENTKTSTGMQRLKALPDDNENTLKTELLADKFSNKASLTLSVDKMPLQDFLHYTFGELLNINYIIGEDLKQDAQTVTMNIRDTISPRRLMQLTSELLIERGVQIKFDNDLYFIHQLKDDKQSQIIIAIGRSPLSVPRTSKEILQVVPLKYGIKFSIESTLKQLTGVSITPDHEQSTLFLRGSRTEILRAIDFINMLDAPANRGRHIGLIHLTYIDSDEFTKQVSLFLVNEGIPVAVDYPQRKNLVMVPIKQIDAIAVFAADQFMLNRVRYWAKIIDKPKANIAKQYFIYHPQFARASDLGGSIAALISGTSSTSSSKTAKKADSKTGAAPSTKRTTGVSSKDVTLVVDDKANAIIFYTFGKEYQKLLPLIEKLDVLPRQVMLDITIAEVTLKDEFKYGVEWSLTKGSLSQNVSNGVSLTSNLDTAIGNALNITGLDGTLNATLSETNGLVNVLSNPTLLVRDGVTASIIVGDEISVIGSTSTDTGGDGRQTTTVEYRKTGLNVEVTPSINAQGIVIMEISQKITNSTPLAAGQSGNPDISERSIKTEVVAQNGKTVILAGLISETKNDSESETPWLADIPLIGYFFKKGGDSINRTELVMLITPRVIERTDQWDDLTESFQQGLQYLKLNAHKESAISERK